jgi:hypothetical protein
MRRLPAVAAVPGLQSSACSGRRSCSLRCTGCDSRRSAFGLAVAEAPRSGFALRFRQGHGLSRGTARLPFPGSRGLAGKPLGTRSRPRAVGRSAGSGIRKRAGASAGEPASNASVVSHSRRPRGEGWGHPGPLEPPCANAPPDREPLAESKGERSRRRRPTQAPQGANAVSDRGAQRGPRPESARASVVFLSPIPKFHSGIRFGK